MKTPLEIVTTLLAKREYAAQELVQKLRQHGYSQEDIETTLQKIIQAGLQSDQRFAISYIRQKESGYGNWYLKKSLKNYGICEHDIDEAFRLAAPSDEKTRAQRLVAKKMENTPPAKDKLLRFLRTKGFTMETIYAAINQENDH